MSASRQLNDIAADIRANWPKVNYAAEPYLTAMACLSTIDSNYFDDSARSVVRYFLSNATAWRGEDARRIKTELKSLL